MHKNIILALLVLIGSCMQCAKTIIAKPNPVIFATITASDLAEIRRNIIKRLKADNSGVHPGCVKADLNAALQAIENWYETNLMLTGSGKTQASTAIDDATTFNFTNAQKKIIGAYWFQWKFSEQLL